MGEKAAAAGASCRNYYEGGNVLRMIKAGLKQQEQKEEKWCVKAGQMIVIWKMMQRGGKTSLFTSVVLWPKPAAWLVRFSAFVTRHMVSERMERAGRERESGVA